MLSDEHITKYQTLYRNRYGREISREVAYEQCVKLMRLVEITYQPTTEEEYQQLQERRKETAHL